MNSPSGRPASRVRLMHFADVHLGVETYGKFNPETGLNTRLEDFTHALNQAITGALEANVDLAVFAGDAYKARDPNQTHQRAFALALKRLTDAGVPVVMLVGNHDIPNTRGRAHALEIYGLLGGAGVTILHSPRIETIATRKGDVLVAGMPYLSRSRVVAQEDARGKGVEEVAHLVQSKYAAYMGELATEAAQERSYLAILTGHFTVAEARVGVQGFLRNPNEPQIALPEVLVGTPSPWDYVALGHVHKFQDMNGNSQPPVVYCGSIDRIDFGERAEQKGYVLADVEKGHAEYKHVALQTRPFLDITIDTTGTEDPTRAILEEIARYPLAHSVVKVTYKVPPEKAALIRSDEIRKALGAAHLTVALSREMPPGEALMRSQVLAEATTPDKALATYIDAQPRLVPRKTALMEAARPLFELLQQEDTVGATG